MKKLIIVRHGRFGTDDSLSEEGRLQTESLATIIKKRINGSDVLLLSSPIKRALESAEIIGTALQVGPKILNALRHANEMESTADQIKRLLSRHEIVIVVAHEPHSVALPPFFTKEKKDFDPLSFSEAYVIDCDSGDWTRIP